MKITNIVLLLTFLLGLQGLHAAEITRIEPAFWWVGMKHHDLQIMVYGPNIASQKVEISYPGVRLERTVIPENPNYLFLYLDIAPETQPGKVNITFIEGKKKTEYPYELRARATTTGAQGFDSSDVLYLIMPDRFANGDTSNDLWDNEAIDRSNAFGRHGGDLAGINKHLDYLSDLGITAIWLNPVLENKMRRGSYHGYATTDFYRVDPRFGTNEDYCGFIANAHKKNIKVVMDMIYNHCGSYHWWMNDLPCADWLNHQGDYVQTTHNLFTIPDPHAPQSEKDALTKGWFVRSMPDLNQQNPLLADYLIQNSIWWIEYARIDGIRHDTHPYADFDFLAEWNKRVADEYPQFNIVGESWYVTTAPLAWWQRHSKVNNRQTYMKTVMDFNFMNTINQALSIDSKDRNPLKAIYEVIAQDFVYEDLNNILVFLDNHDTSRFTKVEDTDLGRFKLAITLLLTTRGIPQLYYGTEILMTGEKKDGDGGLRKDFPGGWEGDTINAFTADGRTLLQNQAHDFLRTLLNWRKTNVATHGGQLIHYAPNARTGCYVYARVKDHDCVLVVLNASNQAQQLTPNTYYEVLGSATSGHDIIGNKTVSLTEPLSIPARDVLVITYKNKP